MSLAKVQDIRSMYKSLLYFYILAKTFEVLNFQMPLKIPPKVKYLSFDLSNAYPASLWWKLQTLKSKRGGGELNGETYCIPGLENSILSKSQCLQLW